jgi:pyruvate-ferredoxin/flavodoxin oxidoreductase
LFEFSGACAGCGETPYIKLASQLFGDRMVVANATGCSSIYGGSLPTTPWSTNDDGRGPAWSNSLFEDNAEFGLGFRLAYDQRHHQAERLVQQLSSQADPAGPIPLALAEALVGADQGDEAGIYEQRQRVAALKATLQAASGDADRISAAARSLLSLADDLVKRSVWMIGGDGWAYDIGFGGIDHLFASHHNVNILVLDTEVYSNTGGQMSKATPLGAVAKFASEGKASAKKDLGMIAMTYGNVYVASIAMGAKSEQSTRAFLEAESYPGVSLVIAYSHCIAHGINMSTAMNYQKEVVDSGRWLLYRYDPRLTEAAKNPLQLDMRSPKLSAEQTMYKENRFKMLSRSNPEEAKKLLKLAQGDINTRWAMYQYLASRHLETGNGKGHGQAGNGTTPVPPTQQPQTVNS